MSTSPNSGRVFASLLPVVERILRESADPEIAEEFDAAAWLEGWLATPAAVLGGQSPGQLAVTPEGFDVVRRLLLSQQSGTYW